ncbi:MAG: protein-L-isoaspartate O-methyltransferase [Pseudomonadota bacterium]
MIDFATRRTMMVDTQVRPSDVTKLPIIDALLKVRREAFVPEDAREAAYIGEHVALGGGRVVLDPRTFAKMLDALDIQPGDLVLDVACGTGYSAAVLSRLAQAVVALEEDAALYADAEATLADEGVDTVALVQGPLAEGAAQHAPFDAILIEGGIEHLPDTFADQLAEGGRIACIMMEGALGIVRVGYKIDGDITWRFSFNATAPLLPGFARAEAFTL